MLIMHMHSVRRRHMHDLQLLGSDPVLPLKHLIFFVVPMYLKRTFRPSSESSSSAYHDRGLHEATSGHRLRL